MAAINHFIVFGFEISFLVLSCSLIIITLLCILGLCCTNIRISIKAPKLIIMSICCVLQLLEALGPWTMSIVRYRQAIYGHGAGISFTCEGIQALVLISSMVWAIVPLLVASILVLEALKLLRRNLSSPRIQMRMSLWLTALSMVYGFVVVVPAFNFLYLKDPTKPCGQYSSGLALKRDFKKMMIYSVLCFVVPHLSIVIAFIPLVVRCFSRRNRDQQGVVVPLSVSESGVNGRRSSGLLDNPDTESPWQGAPSAHRAYNVNARQQLLAHGTLQGAADEETGRQQLTNDAQTTPALDVEGTQPYPKVILAAAIGELVLNFLMIFLMHVPVDLIWDDLSRLLVAGQMMHMLTAVFLPICWLLDINMTRRAGGGDGGYNGGGGSGDAGGGSGGGGGGGRHTAFSADEECQM